MLITREAFEQRQKELAEKAANGTTKTRVGFFSLKSDGDSAIVRFMCDDPNEFDGVLAHTVKTRDGKFKTISCLREGYHDSYDHCPLCKAGERAGTQFYVKMLQYERYENGDVTVSPKIWSRSNSFIQDTLYPKYEENDSLRNIVCKITRRGAGLQTKYTVTKLSSTIYSDDKYTQPEELIEALNKVNLVGSVVSEMTFDEMQDFVSEQLTKEPEKTVEPFLTSTEETF